MIKLIAANLIVHSPIGIITVKALGKAIAIAAIEPGPPINQLVNPFKNPTTGE